MYINRNVCNSSLISTYIKNLNTSNTTNSYKKTTSNLLSKSSNTSNLKYSNRLKGDLTELKFENNILNIERNTPYKVKTLLHGYSDIIITNSGVERLSSLLNPDLDYRDYLSTDEIEDSGRVFDFINILNKNISYDKKIDLIRIFFPQTKEGKAILEGMGAETNNYISLDGGENYVYFDETGWLYTQDELQHLRNSYLRENYFEFGFTKDSKMIIDGTEYKLDNTGHITGIPEDAICTPSHVELIK